MSASVVRSYVGMVRGYNPVVPEDLAGEIADIYSQMRQVRRARRCQPAASDHCQPDRA